MLERIPLALMYDWFWNLFFNAGFFCSALTPGDRVPGFLQFKMWCKFSKWTMGAEAFGPIFDLGFVLCILYVIN